MISELADDQPGQVFLNHIGPGQSCPLVRKSNLAEVIDLLDQVLGMPADVSDLGIVGQIDSRGAASEIRRTEAFNSSGLNCDGEEVTKT